MGVPFGVRWEKGKPLDMVPFMCYNSTMNTEKETKINTRYPADVYAAIKQFALEDTRSFNGW